MHAISRIVRFERNFLRANSSWLNLKKAFYWALPGYVSIEF
jgi:hypothetical protein